MEKINWQDSHGDAPGYEAKHTTQYAIFRTTDEDYGSHEKILALLKNLRANVGALPEIINRGGVLVGDHETVDSMKAWINEAIAEAEK